MEPLGRSKGKCAGFEKYHRKEAGQERGKGHGKDGTHCIGIAVAISKTEGFPKIIHGVPPFS